MEIRKNMMSIGSRVMRKIQLLFNSFRIKNIESQPQLKQLFQKAAAVDRGDLSKRYEAYIRDVSMPDMAASFECVSLLYGLVHASSFKKIADLGSGFSSYAFRKYAATAGEGVVVFSVDDDEHWIKKTADFLRDNQVDTQNLLTMREFQQSTERDFDLIFLDLNFVEVRRNFIPMAIDRCKRGGLIVFDDVHKPEFLYEVLMQTRDTTVKLFDLKPYTLDSFGRFAILAIKN